MGRDARQHKQFARQALMDEICRCLEAGRYQSTPHAWKRMIERQLTLPGIVYVLKHGRHAPKHDEFKDGEWRYAVAGKDLDGVKLRIAVRFDNDGCMIVTVINLDIEG